MFLDASEIEGALENLLDQRLRIPLAFEPIVDWNRGLAASLKRQLAFVMEDFRHYDGVASNQVALASLIDLLVSLALRGLPHNHFGQLGSDQFGVVPACVRRAEEFMRVNSTAPIRLRDVAAAAGCSVRTLNAVFRQFRNRTPLAVLHATRIEQAHAALRANKDGMSVAGVARLYGFTNASRFSLAFQRRFGERPTAVRREHPE